MSNVPSIFAAPPGQGGNNNNNNQQQQQQPGVYVPSQAAGSYTPSAAAAGGYVPSAAASGGGGYVPSAAASGGGGYVPSAAASGGGGYTPSTAANSYMPSTAASSYTPSAAASGSSYTPSAAAGSYTPSAAGSTYIPSAAAAGGNSYTPSVAATGGNSYTPSAAASGGNSYTPSATACSYTPSAAATNYTPSTAATNYMPSAAASAPAPPFSQALDRPPPAPSAPPAPTNRGYQSQPPQQQQQEYKPSANAMTGGAPANNTPYAVAAPMAPRPTTSSYQHGNGPTNGVVSQASNPVQCHKIDYEIKGSEMQLVEVHLDPQETVIAEAGAMMYLEPDVDFKTKFGDGSEPKQGFFKKLMSAGGRLLTGESLFITHFTNTGSSPQPRIAAFAAPYPGTILPIDMMELQQKHPSQSADGKPTSLIAQKDAFLCAAKGTKLSIHFNRKLGSGFFGGEGFILEKISGDGMAFLHAGGCVIKRELQPGEKLRVDTGCLVAFTSGVNYDIQMAPGLKTMFFGGEGLFLATLEGTGTVWLQSLPFSRFADRVIAYSPAAGGQRKGEGGPLGGLGGMLDGDGFGRFQ